MEKQNKKMELLGSVPIPKALLAMGLPGMAGMMINAVYNLADAYFVGGLGTSQMGAISVAFPVGQIVVGLGLLFGNGAASYISRLLGQGDNERADQTASTALYGSVFAGGAVIVAMLLFLRPVLTILGATESIMPYALAYSGIYVAASIFNVFNVTMNNIVTSEGAARMTMCALLSGAVLNMILDPLFIYGLELGVAGAAAATAVSQIFTFGIYLLYIFGGRSVFSFRISKCRYTGKMMGEILKIGIPTLIFQLLTSLSVMLINRQAKGYGDSVIAGMGAATRVISVGSLMVFGFIKGFQPIAGYSYGAKKYDRLREAVRTSILWSTGFCALYGLTMALSAGRVIGAFTAGDGAMIETGSAALRANGLSFVLFGFCTVYSSLFLALGKAKRGFFLGACRQGICFVPVILIMPLFLGKAGILYAQPVADVMTAAVTVIAAIGFYRELKAHSENSSSILRYSS